MYSINTDLFVCRTSQGTNGAGTVSHTDYHQQGHHISSISSNGGHKRHFSNDDTAKNTNENSEEMLLLADRLNIREALEGMDDKTLNGLVQAIDICQPISNVGNSGIERKTDEKSPSPQPTANGNAANTANVYWTPIQRIQQINEFWAAASQPPLSPPNPKMTAEGFGSMAYWQRYVEEFYEVDAPGSSDVGVVIWVQESAFKTTPHHSGSSSNGVGGGYGNIGVAKRPYFIPRSLLPRFFWTMSGGVENSIPINGGDDHSSGLLKSAESPMTRCHIRMQRVRESFVQVPRRGSPGGNHTLLLLEPAESVLQVSRQSGIQTEQYGSMRLWFSVHAGKVVRWEWSVEAAYEWRLLGSGAASFSKGSKLIAGFSPRTWGVLEVHKDQWQPICSWRI